MDAQTIHDILTGCLNFAIFGISCGFGLYILPRILDRVVESNVTQSDLKRLSQEVGQTGKLVEQLQQETASTLKVSQAVLHAVNMLPATQGDSLN